MVDIRIEVIVYAIAYSVIFHKIIDLPKVDNASAVVLLPNPVYYSADDADVVIALSRRLAIQSC